MKNLLLIDSSASYYRLAHAMNANSPGMDFYANVNAGLAYANNQAKKWSKKYPKFFHVHAVDVGSNWRKQVMKQYKGGRKGMRKKSTFDFESFFAAKEIWQQADNDRAMSCSFSIDRAEADDIIFTLGAKYRESVILAADKDFQQLRLPQFNMQGKSVSDPDWCELEHIFKGDVADGIPPCYAHDNALMQDENFPKIKYLKKIRLELAAMTEAERCEKYEFWSRNRTLIDHRCIPSDITDSVLETFHTLYHGKTNNTVASVLDLLK